MAFKQNNDEVISISGTSDSEQDEIVSGRLQKI